MTLLEKLKALGLTGYEAKSYIALMEKSELKAIEVSKIGGIPRSKIYEAMDNLLQKGLCHSIPGQVVKFKGTDPRILKNIVDNKLEKIKDEIKRHEHELSEITHIRDRAIEELSGLFKQGQANTESLSYVETIKDKTLIFERVVGLLSSATKSILTYTKPPHVEPPKYTIEFADAEVEAIKKRGVIARNIYEIPKDPADMPEFLEILQASNGDGEQIRVTDKLPIKLLIIDEETVMYSLKHPVLHKDTFTYTLVKHQDLAGAFKAAFEATWEDSMEFSEFMNKIKNNLI